MRTPSVAVPAIHPAIPLQAVDGRICLNLLDQRLRGECGNLTDDLRANGVGKLLTLAHRNEKCTFSADAAAFVIEVEVLHIAEAARALEHDGKAVDGDALRNGLVAGRNDAPSAAVGPIA